MFFESPATGFGLEPGYGRDLVPMPTNKVVEEYKQKIGSLCFKREEVETWLHVEPPAPIPQQEVNNEQAATATPPGETQPVTTGTGETNGDDGAKQPGEEEKETDISRSEMAKLWEEAYQRELKDFNKDSGYKKTTGKTKERNVFTRQLTTFIEVKIKGTSSAYQIRKEKYGNYYREMKDTTENIVPYMIEKYKLPKP